MGKGEDFNAMEPAILERLRAIMLAFLGGVSDGQAAPLIEELRGFPDVVRIAASDQPEAELMLWFLRGFSVPLDRDGALVFTPEEEGIPASVEYLRRSAAGTWRLRYPGDLWEEA